MRRVAAFGVFGGGERITQTPPVERRKRALHGLADLVFNDHFSAGIEPPIRGRAFIGASGFHEDAAGLEVIGEERVNGRSCRCRLRGVVEKRGDVVREAKKEDSCAGDANAGREERQKNGKQNSAPRAGRGFCTHRPRMALIGWEPHEGVTSVPAH